MIDIILKFDGNNKLYEGYSINKENILELNNKLVDLYRNVSLNDFMNDRKYNIDMIELEGNLYNFQRIIENGKITVLLSRKGMTEHLKQLAVEYFDQGMQIYDKNGYFLYGNKKSEELEEYKNEDFVGKHILELYKLNEEYSTILTTLRTQEPVINRCDRFKVKSGKVLTTMNTAYPLFSNKELSGAVVFESDITSIKSYENMSLDFENYLKSENDDSKNTMYSFPDIIYESKELEKIIEFGKKVSLTDSSVLIQGDTGTGKELFAQSIHTFGKRRFKPFIDVNCSAIPDGLFEGLFFGTEVGAFTGSVSNEGLFEQANGGTLFLDEINSISLDKQAKLLRVLEEKSFKRLGGKNNINCDIRIISATNEDLEELVRNGRMREDFYYRIAVVKLKIPSLSERKSDIKVLSNYFLDLLSKRYLFGPNSLSDEVLSRFKSYNWPGNIRELKNVIEFSFNNCDRSNSELNIKCIPEFLQNQELIMHKKDMSNITLNSLLNNYEKEIIEKMLNENGNNITKTALKLGISRQNLQYRIKKNNINTGEN